MPLKLKAVAGQRPVIKMSAEQKTAWISALRSGNFLQTRGILIGVIEQPDLLEDEPPPLYGYCCLGVLQKVVSGDVSRFKDGDSFLLPSEEWLRDNNIKFNPYSDMFRDSECADVELMVYYADGNELDQTKIRVSKLNDDGYTFEEIADLIEPLIEVV